MGFSCQEADDESSLLLIEKRHNMIRSLVLHGFGAMW
jgi:hypothetical protein